MFALFALYFLTLVIATKALYQGPFQSTNWIEDHESSLNINESTQTTIIVALHLRNQDKLQSHFHSVSDPKSDSYGHYLSLAQARDLYSPTTSDLNMVMDHFMLISGSTITYNQKGDMLHIKCGVQQAEAFFSTQLVWHRHSTSHKSKRSLRAVQPLMNIPEHISDKVSFISLNSPINHMNPRYIDPQSQSHSQSQARAAASTPSTVGITPGNEEALVSFQPLCGDGSLNQDSSPCSTLPAAGRTLYRLYIDTFLTLY